VNVLLLLFVYNRPKHTARTLEALAKNTGASSIPLIVYSDGAASVEDRGRLGEVREVCKRAQGFASVTTVERSENLGLAASIRRGVSEAFTEADAVVVMEDDLLAHPVFLSYMIGALEACRGDARIMSVSACVPPRILMPRPRSFQGDVWLSKRNLSFGWGVWKDRWESVDWDQAEQDGFEQNEELRQGFAEGGRDLPAMMDKQLRGETDSWAIHFSYAHFRQQRFSLLPRDSYVSPIGFDGSGVHCKPSPLAWFSTTRHACTDPVFPKELKVNPELQAAFRKYYDCQYMMAKFLGRV
jgi:hypothetical protein